MKEEIEKFKKDNGNISYTVKELIQGLHVKVDNLNDKMASKASKKMVIGMYGTLFTLIAALASFVVWSV